MLYTCLRWSASARAHVHTPLPYLANGWADCVQTWCVANDPLDERLTQVRCGVHLHVRTCTPPSNDGASSPARPSPIKASYWLIIVPSFYTLSYIRDSPIKQPEFHPIPCPTPPFCPPQILHMMPTRSAQQRAPAAFPAPDLSWARLSTVQGFLDVRTLYFSCLDKRHMHTHCYEDPV